MPCKGLFGQMTFLILVVLGAVSIIFLKISTYNIPLPYIYIIPIGCIIFYGIWCSYSQYFKLRPDKAGDNIYYLGFLYTLVSLAVSLYQTTNSTENQETIISNFGIALATTICGVVGRVLFTQRKYTPFEVEQETVSLLTKAAYRLKGELNATLSDFSLFRTALRQSIKEWEVEWRDERKSQLKTTIETIFEVEQETVGSLTKVAQRLKEELNATLNDFGIFRTTLRQSVKDLESEWRDERKSQLKNTTETITKNISLVVKENYKAVIAMRDLTKNINLVSEKMMNINLSKDLLKDQLSSPVEELHSFLQHFATSFQNKLQNIESSSEALVDFVEKEKSYAEAITRMEECSVKQITISENIITDLNNHFVSFGSFVDNEAERLEIQTEAMNEQLKKLVNVYGFLAEQEKEKQEYFKVTNDKADDYFTNSYKALMESISVQNQMLEKILIKDLTKYADVVPQCIKEIAEFSASLSELTKNETSLSKTILDFNEHEQHLIATSRNNISMVNNNIEKFGDMVQAQSIKLNTQIDNTETYFNKMQTLYEQMVLSMKISNQHNEKQQQKVNHILSQDSKSKGFFGFKKN